MLACWQSARPSQVDVDHDPERLRRLAEGAAEGHPSGEQLAEDTVDQSLLLLVRSSSARNVCECKLRAPPPAPILVM